MSYDLFGLIGGFIILIFITIQDIKYGKISNYMLLLFFVFSLFRLFSNLHQIFFSFIFMAITGIICDLLWKKGLIKGGDYKILEINALFLNPLYNFYLINLKLHTSDLNQFYLILFLILFFRFFLNMKKKVIAFSPLFLFSNIITSII